MTFCLLALLLPWLPRAIPGLDALDSVLALQCHRLEGRSWLIAGQPMAMCSRCAGIYLGVALGTALGWPRLSVRRTIFLALSALALLVVEASLEAFGGIPSINALRSATGLALAWPIAATAVLAFSGIRLRVRLPSS